MIIIGEKYLEEIKELSNYDKVITFKPNNNLDDEINNHADIHIFKAENKSLIISDYVAGELKPVLNGYNLSYCKNIKSPYPDDIKLNALNLSDKIICNTKYVSKNIIDYSKKNNIQLLHTNQGYSKCSVCVINNNAVITDSVEIASLLKIYQTDVLQIKPGFIKLSHKHYGFIGGASGMVNNNTLYFSGDISKHPDFNKIIGFTRNYNIDITFNKNRPLTDFGGFIKL